MNLPSRIIRLSFACSLLAVSASAALVPVSTIADAFVTSASPTGNYGGAGAIGVAAAGLPKGEFDSVLKFDLAAAKAQFDTLFGAGTWTITDISLQLTAAPPANATFNGNGTGPGGTNVNTAGLLAIRWMQNDLWTEGTGTPGAPGATGITFSTLPSFLSGADEALGTFGVSSATSGASAPFSLPLTPAFLADSTGGNVVSFELTPADTSIAYLADSRSFGTTSFRPVLKVSAVPEPGTALFGTALLAASGLARRRSRRGV